MAMLGTKNIKELTGIVVKNAMNATAVVSVESTGYDKLYKKRFVVAKKYYAHVLQPVQEGQRVVIRQTKPISKTKKWMVIA